MTLLAPWWLVAGAGAALAVVALHLIARHVLPPTPLPTARFIPVHPARASARALRPTDPLLLVLRVLIVLLIALALAGPVAAPARVPVARVILLDRSRAAARAGAALDDSVAALARDGDLVVAFDSAAAPPLAVHGRWRGASPATRAAGSISTALVAGQRAALALRARADSVAMVLVSPVAREELDAATPGIRALWPGRIRLVGAEPSRGRDSSGTAAPLEHGAAPALDVRPAATGDDPVSAAARLFALQRADAPARVVRGAATAADSAWARRGHVLVLWPAAGPPPRWRTRDVADTVGALAAPGALLVSPFVRRWQPAGGGRITRVVARWGDGAPAAVERALAMGCVREVGVMLPRASDLAIRPAFARFLAALAAPCGGATDLRPADDAARSMLAGRGGPTPTALLATLPLRDAPLVPWLLGAALALVLPEMLVRRRAPRAGGEGA